MTAPRLISALLNWGNRYSSAVPHSADGDLKKVLLVYCHAVDSSKASYCGAILDKVLETLKKKGHETRVTDLTQSALDPRLRLSSGKAYFETDELLQDPLVAAAVKDVQWANAIIFLYPTWWCNVPAMLKGYIDRIFLPNIAFTVEGSVLQPNLLHIKTVVGITTYGSPWWDIFRSGDAGRCMIMGALYPLFHSHCRRKWLPCYAADGPEHQAHRTQFLVDVESYFVNVF